MRLDLVRLGFLERVDVKLLQFLALESANNIIMYKQHGTMVVCNVVTSFLHPRITSAPPTRGGGVTYIECKLAVLSCSIFFKSMFQLRIRI